PYPFIDLCPAVGKDANNLTTTRPIHPGIVACADELVACENAELACLPSQLLGQTLIVQDLETAQELAGRNRGFRYVTLAGEVLETDGALTIGAHHAETGILSRKSELRELRLQNETLDKRIAETEQAVVDFRERAGALDSRLGSVQEEINVL